MQMIPRANGSKYYRGFLTVHGMAVYDMICNQLMVKDYSGRLYITIRNGSPVSSDCFAAYKAVRDDHPEYFFLGQHVEFTRCGTVGTLTYSMLYSPDIIERIQLQLRKMICNLVTGTYSKDTIEMERLVYERIAKRAEYNDNNDVKDHNVVGPVLTSSGVCEGHNALLILCYRRLGIPCVKVYGKTKKGIYHCWTIAWINGIPAHCDVTWDISKDDVIFYNYFNLSDRQIGIDHLEFDASNIPKCNSELVNYYRYNGHCVRSFDELCRKLRFDYSNGRRPYLLHFDYCPSSKDYLKECSRALNQINIEGNHTIKFHSDHQNIAVVRE